MDVLAFNLAKNSELKGGNSSMKYKEILIEESLEGLENKNINANLGMNIMLITTIYLQATTNVSLRINDKIEDGFNMYSMENNSSFSDAIFLLYKDKDDSKNLHVEIENKSLSPSSVKIKILGLEV